MAQDLRQETPSTTSTCTRLPDPPSWPCYKPPEKCEPSIKCPGTTANPPDCFEDLIKGEADAVSKGEQARKFKADLEALMAKVKAATLDYTQDAYDDLVERWNREEENIGCLISSIGCAFPCWHDVIECEICPLINDILHLESKLSGEAKTCKKDKPESCVEATAAAAKPEPLTSVYDIRHWWWREKLRRRALFDQVAAVMKAWETPFKTLDAALKSNAEILKNATAMLGVDQKKDAAKVLFDVFFRLIPTHVVIAPSGVTSCFADECSKYCCCDNSPIVHVCCGLVIRLPTVRDRIIGAQPYLIEPAEYANLVCCLAQNVYQPAKAQAAEADSRYAEYDTEAKAAEAAIEAQLKSLATNAKVRLAKTFDCNAYKSSDGDGSKRKCCGDGASVQAEDPAQAGG